MYIHPYVRDGVSGLFLFWRTVSMFPTYTTHNHNSYRFSPFWIFPGTASDRKPSFYIAYFFTERMLANIFHFFCALLVLHLIISRTNFRRARKKKGGMYFKRPLKIYLLKKWSTCIVSSEIWTFNFHLWWLEVPKAENTIGNIRSNSIRRS